MEAEGPSLSWPLAAVLAVFFALFNQALFATMEILLTQRGEVETAATFARLSLVGGVVTLMALAVLAAIARPLRWTDVTLFALGIAVSAWPWLPTGYEPRAIGRSQSFSLGNALIAIWLSRGLWRLWRVKKREKT